MSTLAMEKQFLSPFHGMQVTPMDQVQIVLLLVLITRMDGLMLDAVIQLLQFVKECIVKSLFSS